MLDKISRRKIIKAFATLPVLAGMGGSIWYKQNVRSNSVEHQDFRDITKIRFPEFKSTSEKIKLGIIGVGYRGEYLLRAIGFAHPNWVEKMEAEKQKNPNNTKLQEFLSQESLNVEISAICDVFDERIKKAKEIAIGITSEKADSQSSAKPRVYKNYLDLLNDKDIDAVIIATPDHWHAKMAMDAAIAGKHVYQEKCFARTADEAIRLYDTLSHSKIVYQLGHQNQQIESHLIARNIIDRGLLGDMSLILGSTRRNRAGNGKFPASASPKTIDWSLYEAICENKHSFDLKRFFWWRNYFDYSTGQFGDLLSHEFAAINQIARLGIPSKVSTTGGVFIYGEDGRETPDVFASVFEFPERQLILNYNLTMGSSQGGNRVFIGKEALMDAEKNVHVYPEPGSEKYSESGSESVFDFVQGHGVDAVSSATEQYFAKKGLYYTYRDGKLVDSTHLHIREWLDCIRHGGVPSCNRELGFQEAVACIMASESYRQKRPVSWDELNKQII